MASPFAALVQGVSAAQLLKEKVQRLADSINERTKGAPELEGMETPSVLDMMPGGGAVGRVGVKPGMEKMASQLTRRGLRGPWFHGTHEVENVLGRGAGGETRAQTIAFWQDKLAHAKNPGDVRDATENLKAWSAPTGFDPAKVGSQTGTRLGEPAGISLTRDPRVASTFGDVLRVGVDVPPSSVGQFVDPEFQKVLRYANEHALNTPLQTPLSIGQREARPGVPAFPPIALVRKTAERQAAGEYPAAGWHYRPVETFRNLLNANALHGAPINQADKVAYNQAMTDMLRSQGLEAIQYNPRRWAEHELRVLDPTKAVPLGVIESPGNLSGARSSFLNNPIMRRYYEGSGTSGAFGQNPYYGLRTKLDKEFLNAPEFPSRLKDVLLGASD
jgi:hypothetical protein